MLDFLIFLLFAGGISVKVIDYLLTRKVIDVIQNNEFVEFNTSKIEEAGKKSLTYGLLTCILLLSVWIIGNYIGVNRYILFAFVTFLFLITVFFSFYSIYHELLLLSRARGLKKK